MAAANHLLKLNSGGNLLFSRCNIAINGGRVLCLSLSSPTKPSLSLSSTSPFNSTCPTPATATKRHVRCLCLATDTAFSSSSSYSSPDMNEMKEMSKLLDIRVGKILKAWRHPDADSLYVEEVDIGEDELRTICSGLVKYVPIEHLQDKKVLVLANLKPRNMRGIKSCGMLMAASDASHENVELLVPPEESVPGERIWFGPEDEKENQPAAASPNQIQKKKVWESVQPHLKTDATCVAMLDGHYMRTSAGPVVSRSLKNANIS